MDARTQGYINVIMIFALLVLVSMLFPACSTPNEDPSDFFRKNERWGPLAPELIQPL